jgi:hypothetical protein
MSVSSTLRDAKKPPSNSPEAPHRLPRGGGSHPDGKSPLALGKGLGVRLFLFLSEQKGFSIKNPSAPPFLSIFELPTPHITFVFNPLFLLLHKNTKY